MILLWAVPALWALWVVANVVLLLASPYLMASQPGPFTNGIQIVVPAGVAEIVTPDELEAMLAHERGHVAHRHSLQNLMRACLLIPRTPALYRRQELEADDYAAARVDPGVLASAIRKLSFNNFDWARADRLDGIAARRPT